MSKQKRKCRRVDKPQEMCMVWTPGRVGGKGGDTRRSIRSVEASGPPYRWPGVFRGWQLHLCDGSTALSVGGQDWYTHLEWVVKCY